MDMPLEMRAETNREADLRSLTATVVAAYVSHNSLSTADLPKLIVDTHFALTRLANGLAEESGPELVPAVSVRKSVTPDYLVCLDDGKKFRSLKRHIGALGMTPDQYRTKWDLPLDYPMVAPNYSATRSALAKSIGLGKKPARETPKTASNGKAKAKSKAKARG